MIGAAGQRHSGAGPGARIDAGRDSSGDGEARSAVGDLSGQGSVSVIMKASALNTYAAMKSGGGQGPPPLVATSTASPIHGVDTSTLVRNLLLTGCLFCGPLFLTFCFLNTIAIAYSATAALPFGTIRVIVLIWTLVTFPLL
ncbi:transmembrane 9 superfamily member 3-like isoform X2 [Miscanthus floridulus]|uniref:transmembrane 9 superfamily member 3-like isoform X2 n=1 Tax=Miscanthus floridulus TaxID=154761 RepID=UPI00345A950A